MMTNTRKFTEKEVQNLKTMSDRLVAVSREITSGGENKIKRMLLPFQSYSRFLEDLPEGQGREYDSETTYNRGDIVWAPLPQVGIPAYFVCLTDGTIGSSPIGVAGYPQPGWCLAGFGGGIGRLSQSGTGEADGPLCVAEGAGTRAAGVMCKVGQNFPVGSYVYFGAWESGITYFGDAVVRHGGDFFRINGDMRSDGTTQEPSPGATDWDLDTDGGRAARIAIMEADGVSAFGSMIMDIHPHTTAVPADHLFDISRAVTLEIKDYADDMSPEQAFLLEGLYTAIVEDAGAYKQVELIYTDVDWQENGRVYPRATYSNVPLDLWRDAYFPAFMALMSGGVFTESDVMLGSEAKGLMVQVTKPNCSASGAMHLIEHSGCHASGSGVLSQWNYSSYLAGDVREYSRGQKVRVPLTGEHISLQGTYYPWAASTSYAYGDIVSHEDQGISTNYVCVRGHMSNSGNSPGSLSPGSSIWLAESIKGSEVMGICKPLGSHMASTLMTDAFELPEIAGTYFIKGSFLVRSLGSSMASGETVAVFSVNMVVECDQDGIQTLRKEEITQEYPGYPEIPDVDFTVWRTSAMEVQFKIVDTSGLDESILFFSGEVDIHMFIEPGEWPTP